MARDTIVSICCITYNHKDYIRQALDSFLMQKTSFKFEVLIHDDASTDGTTEIIKEYADKYPDVIKPMYQKENQYSKGVRGMTVKYNLPRALGKYIALCEGDDYWTDEDKLQKQVDFMETHPDYSVCFHKVKVVYENGEKANQIYPDVASKRWYTTEQLVDVNYIQTNSVLYRKLPHYEDPQSVMPMDWYLHLIHAREGKIHMIDKVMSVYRKHPKGMWWDYDTDRDLLWEKYGPDHLAMWVRLGKIYEGVGGVERRIWGQVIRCLIDLRRIDSERNSSLVSSFTSRYKSYIPDLFTVLLHDRDYTNNVVSTLRGENAGLIERLHHAEEKLDEIHKSKVWRARNKLAKGIGRSEI